MERIQCRPTKSTDRPAHRPKKKFILFFSVAQPVRDNWNNKRVTEYIIILQISCMFTSYIISSTLGFFSINVLRFCNQA